MSGRVAHSADLQAKARLLRRRVLTALYRAQSGHPGSSMSAMEMLIALYCGSVLRHTPTEPCDPDRDYMLLSNGHACPALYAVLEEAGYFLTGELDRLRQLGAGAQGHPHKESLPGVEITSGSLGMGLSVGIGLAYALKLKGKQNRVYVMMSDGEQEEGSTWEAIMFAPKLGLDNLIAIVDKNQFQIDGATEDVMPGLDPLAAKYRAFNWHVQEINGHSFEKIFAAFAVAQRVRGPAVLISHTMRGKGVSFMEGSSHWHAGVITQEQYAQAMKELV